MSKAYDDYLADHIQSVWKGFDWIQANLPELIPIGLDVSNVMAHDESKYTEEEYDAYDLYFYGERTPEVQKAFDLAWLHHIHHNPHHWQSWVLFEDEGGINKPKPLKMPFKYLLEMICDWWAFSWRSGNLYEIFDWYESHKDKMILYSESRKEVENILDKIREKLTELDKADGVVENDRKETLG